MRRSNGKLFKTLGIASLVAFSAATISNAQTISGQEFVNTHAGKCVTYWGESDGTQCFTADGRTSYNDKSYGKDTGTWRVKGNELCTTWSQEGVESCGLVEKVGEGIYREEGYTWKIQ